MTGCPANQNSQTALRTDLAGLYLTFSLERETYGLHILKVQEIIEIRPVRSVPQCPEHIRGVVDLRGKIIPIADLRVKFTMPTQEDTPRTCIIVVQVSVGDRDITMGAIVDEVVEVLDIAAGQIEPPPDMGEALAAEFIRAVAKVDEKVVVLLDVDELLGDNDLSEMAHGMTDSKHTQ